MAEITYKDFNQVEMKTGKIVRAEAFPKARVPAYKLWIDFGDGQLKTSSAQVTKLYSLEELIGSTIVAVTNFPTKQIADFKSEVLVLGVEETKGEVVLLKPDKEVKSGLRVF